MRTSLLVIAALFASANAQESNGNAAADSALENFDPTDKNEAKAEAPPKKVPAFNEPSFSIGTHPSSAGLIQIQSACAQFGVSGVTCGPSDEELFATGMNGDEDLGEDITMKGDKFHFNQNLVQAGEPGTGTAVVYDTKGYGPVEKLSFFDPKIAKAHTSFYSQFATGMNGDEDLGEDITMKGDKFHFNQRLSQFATGMNGDEDLGEDITMKGDKFHFNQRPYGLSQFATGMNGDEDLGEDITMKGDKFHFAQSFAQAPKKKAGGSTDVVYSTEGYGPVEKLSFFDPKITKAHTSFYAQTQEPGTGAPIVYDTKGYGPVEKLSFFDPKITKAHTSFYAQAEPEATVKGDYPPPEKVHTLDPKIAKAHTTFYNRSLMQEEPAATAPPASTVGEPEKVSVLDPKIAKAHTTFYH